MASSNPYYGWVRDLEAAQAVVTEYSFAPSTSYAILFRFQTAREYL
jgi:hypothetical protein